MIPLVTVGPLGELGDSISRSNTSTFGVWYQSGRHELSLDSIILRVELQKVSHYCVCRR